MSEVTVPSRVRQERVRAICRKHWLGIAESAEHTAAADEIRHRYVVTASEHYKGAIRLYETLTSPARRSTAPPPAFTQLNRNVQLFLAYSALWEAFRHIYNAASYTRFALNGPERGPLEDERTKIDRVLRPPLLTEPDVARIGLLRNEETAGGALARMLSRSSRELEQIEGQAHDQTLTDMDAFMQGTIDVAETQNADGTWQIRQGWEAWVIRALNDDGDRTDPDSEFGVAKYRSVIKWLCYQIRKNINFVDKSDDSLDDAILVNRAFCLLDPIVGILLQESRKAGIFAL